MAEEADRAAVEAAEFDPIPLDLSHRLGWLSRVRPDS